MSIFSRLTLFLVCVGLLSAYSAFSSSYLDSKGKKAIEPENIPPVSIQLWSVNETLKKDFAGTLKAISKMGFEAVEFAGHFGPYGEDPQGLKKFLDSLHLKVSGAHVKMRDLTDDKFLNTVRFYQQLGTPMLIVPSDKRAEHADTIDAFVAQVNKVAAKMRDTGMGFGFHNHDRELVQYQNSTFWDYIATHTADDFILQLDVGWTVYAGKDPVAYINRYPNRTLTTHLKAKFPSNTKGKKPLIGQDITNWASVIRACVINGGTQWLVLEQEEYPDGLSQLEAVEKSKQGLDAVIRQITAVKATHLSLSSAQ
ncbi:MULTISPECIES: sugar phosphate isomerase/epimerase family protein [Pseudoalteromonas]|uniref:Sugar phosphate isomerase n=1 Tax=Pseudoalteromonas amylolytica TaxID=1859457 RepID=A0A1S1N088_9GAMM|nr:MULTISPECIES: sugar phosphate isomerase/epimerase [Pseudoalteromonas]OHU90555.1 sugar phosphate isomerase [Pseudoalteromonas sp. JW3]OHU92823.1 sugar phosphate isomerase [Pseudoalteromonas amylolytica]